MLRLLAEGKSNKEVASALGIPVKTVETHRAKIMRNLRLASFSELVRYAVRHRMIRLWLAHPSFPLIDLLVNPSRCRRRGGHPAGGNAKWG